MVDVFNIALSSRRARIFPDRRDVALAAGRRQVLDTTGPGKGKGPKQVASSAAANRCPQPC